jgi:nucleoside-diphosphate-sugar epimerase
MTKGTPIVVTGASGYVASWIVRELLKEGHTVRGTVRDRSRKDKVQHLLDLDKELPGSLELVEADLLKTGSFDEAVMGAGLVIHTASPFLTDGIKDPQRQLVDPALKGTRNVLDSVNRSASVDRVVLTSSVVAVYGDAKDKENTETGVFDERYWNTTSSLSHQPYSYSKTVAEQAAWEMHDQQDRWSLVTINPGFVLGPSLSKRLDGASTSFVKTFAEGNLKSGVPALYFGIVDVRDLARAHVLAGLKEDAKGRNIAVSETLSMKEMGQVLQEKFNNRLPVSSRVLPKFMMYLVGPMLGLNWKYVSRNIGIPLHFSNEKIKSELGLEFRPASESIVEHLEQLVDDGLVTIN